MQKYAAKLVKVGGFEVIDNLFSFSPPIEGGNFTAYSADPAVDFAFRSSTVKAVSEAQSKDGSTTYFFDTANSSYSVTMTPAS